MQLLEVHLKTAPFEAMLAFYQETLGLAVSLIHAKSFAIHAGHSKLIFESYEGPEDPYYHFAFNIPENQIEDAVDWLQKRTSILLYRQKAIVDFPNWNAHAVYFKDPAGNVVELIARHDLPTAQSLPFDGKQLLYLSEIGVACANVTGLREALHSNVGVGYFEKSIPSENFTAMGEQDGLLILSEQARNWLPTEQPAHIFPIHLKMDGPFSGLFKHPDSLLEIQGSITTKNN